MYRLLLTIFVSLCCATTLCAQDDDMVNDSILFEKPDTIRPDSSKTSASERDLMGHIVSTLDSSDSIYVEPNMYNFAFMMQNTNFFQSYNLRAMSDDGQIQRISLAPASMFRVGPYFGWRWLFFGYTFDVSRPSKAGKTAQFNISLYSARVGCDFVYVKNTSNFHFTSVSGFNDVNTEDVKGMDFHGMNTYNMSLNLYYVFNFHRFSYPAAYSQSTRQLRSAGSFILGLRYDKSRCNFDYNALPEVLLQEDRLFDGFKGASYNHKNFSISFGYAYNWVPLRNVLVSASVMPSLGYRLQKGENFKFDTKRVWTNVKNLNIDFVNRAAIVWNNGRYFCGGSVVNYLYNYRSGKFGVTNALTYCNVYVGLNFLKRKQYRQPGKSKW